MRQQLTASFDSQTSTPLAGNPLAENTFAVMFKSDTAVLEVSRQTHEAASHVDKQMRQAELDAYHSRIHSVLLSCFDENPNEGQSSPILATYSTPHQSSSDPHSSTSLSTPSSASLPRQKSCD